MKPTFEKTVDVLVKAYLNNTLEHGNCQACAVGNMVAAACGYTYHEDELRQRWIEKSGASWQNLVLAPDLSTALRNEAVFEIESTGYTILELSNIEKAFETNKSTDGFLGLMAVVDVLAEIHGIDLTVKEEAKLLFVKL